MNKLRILSRQGDTTVVWDAAKVEAGDQEAIAAVREAERIFKAAKARGASAFAVSQGEPAVRVDKFDPTRPEQIIIPRMVGG